MRILWASNAPWNPSGYGTQTAQITRKLAEDGHEVAIAANFGLAGDTLRWNGMTVYPNGYDAYGNDVIPYLYNKFADGKPALLVTLFDVWVWAGNAAMDDIPIASWTPVDHLPVPPQVREFVSAPKRRPIAMSLFGQQALADEGIKAPYVPHGIDRTIFKPTPSDVRKVMGIPEDAFLVTINAANRDKTMRKSWPEMLGAFKVLSDQRDDAYLYLHTSLEDANGISIRVLLASLGIPDSRVRIVPQPQYRLGEVSAETMANVYSASDVLLATSRGEGFGIPVIEAQACGTPVIVSDSTAQPELLGAGWKVKTQPGWDFTQGAWWGQPLLGHIVDALHAAYEARGSSELKAQAVAFSEQFDADTVYETHWRPVLKDLEQWIAPPITRQGRRAEARKALRAKAA